MIGWNTIESAPSVSTARIRSASSRSFCEEIATQKERLEADLIRAVLTEGALSIGFDRERTFREHRADPIGLQPLLLRGDLLALHLVGCEAGQHLEELHVPVAEPRGGEIGRESVGK